MGVGVVWCGVGCGVSQLYVAVLDKLVLTDVGEKEKLFSCLSFFFPAGALR